MLTAKCSVAEPCQDIQYLLVHLAHARLTEKTFSCHTQACNNNIFQPSADLRGRLSNFAHVAYRPSNLHFL